MAMGLDRISFNLIMILNVLATIISLYTEHLFARLTRHSRYARQRIFTVDINYFGLPQFCLLGSPIFNVNFWDFGGMYNIFFSSHSLALNLALRVNILFFVRKSA